MSFNFSIHFCPKFSLAFGGALHIGSTILSNQDIITRYHDLWHVEQAFRIAKSDLASRPVFHYKNQAVRSHILICFTALMFSKYLEIKTKLPIRKIIDSIWNVKEAKLFNKVTSQTISLESEVTSKLNWQKSGVI